MEQQKDNFTVQNLVHRCKSETNPFWKKIRNAMIAVGTISGALIITPNIPALIVTLAGYGVAVGIVGTTLAQLTKK